MGFLCFCVVCGSTLGCWRLKRQKAIEFSKCCGHSANSNIALDFEVGGQETRAFECDEEAFMTLKAAVVGYGGLGRTHAQTLSQLDGVELVAICDKHPERIRAGDLAFNIDTGRKTLDISRCRAYTDMKPMLKKEKPDIVVLAVPTDLHAPLAIAAMKAGCHVFCEKPMALNTRQCDAMIIASEKSGRQLMVGQCLRFWWEYHALREMILDKKYGQLISLTLGRFGNYPDWTADNWMMDARRSGGAILDLHLHDVDWAIHALGAPARIFADGRTGKTGGYDEVTAVWDYYDGPMVTIRGSWLHTSFSMTFRAVFNDAVAEYGYQPDPALRVIRRNGTIEKMTPPASSAYFDEMKYFIECLMGKHENSICMPQSTRESVNMVLLEAKSIAKGKAIAIRRL